LEEDEVNTRASVFSIEVTDMLPGWSPTAARCPEAACATGTEFATCSSVLILMKLNAAEGWLGSNLAGRTTTSAEDVYTGV
jgi:hypothetical protein